MFFTMLIGPVIVMGTAASDLNALPSKVYDNYNLNPDSQQTKDVEKHLHDKVENNHHHCHHHHYHCYYAFVDVVDGCCCCLQSCCRRQRLGVTGAVTSNDS